MNIKQRAIVVRFYLTDQQKSLLRRFMRAHGGYRNSLRQLLYSKGYAALGDAQDWQAEEEAHRERVKRYSDTSRA